MNKNNWISTLAITLIAWILHFGISVLLVPYSWVDSYFLFAYSSIIFAILVVLPIVLIFQMKGKWRKRVIIGETIIILLFFANMTLWYSGLNHLPPRNLMKKYDMGYYGVDVCPIYDRTKPPEYDRIECVWNAYSENVPYDERRKAFVKQITAVILIYGNLPPIAAH